MEGPAPTSAPAEGNEAGAQRSSVALDLDAAVRVRSGLPLLRARAAAAACGAALGATVAYVGGSVTAQKEGWRPHFHRWLCGRIRVPMGHTQTNASLGNLGAKLLSFLVDDWVCSEETPDLVFLETAVNDGDNLLESGDVLGNLRALEGIVRELRSRGCEVVLVDVHLRCDIAPSKRSGTLAWVDSEDGSHVYEQVRLLHERVAEHYGLPSVCVTAALQKLDSEALDAIFRDDCHTTALGGSVLASAVAAAVERCLAQDGKTAALLPPPLDALFWSGGAAHRVERVHIMQAQPGRPVQQRADVDALTGAPGPWWLLSPGDALRLPFEGTALALLTHVGPDAGVLRCRISAVGSEGAVVHESSTILFDKWSYYYRLAVVLLADCLPPGRYTAEVTLMEEAPDRAVAKKALQPRVAGKLQLWAQHFLTCA